MGAGLAVLRRLVQARPVRGSVPFTVILCAFSGAGLPPAPYDFNYYQNSFLFNGLSAYFNEVSLGNLDFAGSRVGGWYRASLTYAQARNSTRQAYWASCVNAAAKQGFTAPSGQLVFIVTFPDIDLFAFPGQGAMVPYNAPVNALSHEMGHMLMLEHSFANDGYKNPASWAVVGEYGDPWDIMSYGNVYGTNSPYHETGPGPAAYHMDRLGWLPIDETLLFGKDGAAAGTYALQPLTGNGTGAVGSYRMISIYVNTSDPFEHVTVELRTKNGVNAGIPNDGQVLIHHVKRMVLYVPARVLYAPVLIYEMTSTPYIPAQGYQTGNTTIRVLRSSSSGAVVHISTPGQPCSTGYVWRGIFPNDTVCVTTAERARCRQESQQAPDTNASGNCAGGLVPRAAVPGDTACVSAVRASAVAADNAAWPDRTWVSDIWGPCQCKPGLVWRLADRFDWVCVDPDVQTLVAQQAANQSAVLAAVAGNGTTTRASSSACPSPLVCREAYPGDCVCVTQQEANDQAHYTAAASSQLLLEIA